MAATEDRRTPGRWVAHAQNGNVYVSAGMQQMVAQVYAPAGSDAMANARVIAASPLLLKALKGMLEVYGITAGDYEKRGIGSASEVRLSDEARAAVAAAEGDA